MNLHRSGKPRNSRGRRRIDQRFQFTGFSWSIFDMVENTGIEPSECRDEVVLVYRWGGMFFFLAL